MVDSSKQALKGTIIKNSYTFFLNFFNDRAEKYIHQKYSDFKVNPFTIQANATAFGNVINSEVLAKAIAYPFALGSSISTSFGTNIQKFIVTTMGKDIARPSVISGMDIEYIDAIDGRNKYCQLKAGPQTINKDDIKTIEDHFKDLRNLAKTNHLSITQDDPIVGVLYGTHVNLSSMYKAIEKDGYTVLAGDEFWYHLTGIKDIYTEIVLQAQKAAQEANFKNSIDTMIKTIQSGVEQDCTFFGLQ